VVPVVAVDTVAFNLWPVVPVVVSLKPVVVIVALSFSPVVPVVTVILATTPVLC
jgi:hypothetical protein